MSLRPKAINYDEYWSRLSNVALNVLKCEQISKLQWNSSFSDVYEVCVAKKDGSEVYAESLYIDTFNLIQHHIESIEKEIDNTGLAEFLPVYVQRWQTFYQGLEYLHGLYSYVNTQHVKNRRPTESDICYSQAVINVSENNMEIREMGLELWKDTVMKIGDNLKFCLLKEIENDREGCRSYQFDCISEAIRSLIIVGNTIVSTMNKICPYESLFENDFLSATMKFYKHWSLDRSSNLSSSGYVIEALDLRKHEEQRCRNCYGESMKKIWEYFRDVVVVEQLNFLNSSVKDIVDNESRNDLRNMFILLSPYDLCTEMRNRLYIHVVEAVRTTISSIYANSTSAHSLFVSELTKSRNRFYTFNREIFDEDTQFRNVIDKAFTKAINEKHDMTILRNSSEVILKSDSFSEHSMDQTDSSSVDTQFSTMPRVPKPADLLNRYVDILLRKQAKSLSDQDFELAIDNFIILFKYIEDKDAFQKHYQRSLCKRLIYSQNLVMENEENVINQIKSVCGLEYTNPFQRMFNDIQLISQLNSSFTDYLSQNPDILMPCTSQFMVLTNCSWPITSNPVEFKLYPDLLHSFGLFYKFYVQKFQGKELKLTNQFSTVELQTNYTPKSYFITVGSLQATILLQYDVFDSDDITTHKLLEVLGLAVETELEKVLSALVENRLLVRKDNDIYSLNRQFVSKRFKIRLLPSSREKETNTIVEYETVDRQINDDRKFFIQAAIVRIMKARKHLNHTMLMKEVLDQAKGRFLPAIPMIKKCIEILIDKCYMERNPDNSDSYLYLA